MIVGIGVDLVAIDRIDRLLLKFPERARSRLFTGAEVRYCESSRCPRESYAARFAAKEALFKALGTGWSGGVGWTDVEVHRDESAPCIRLSGDSAKLAATRGIQRIHLSLSHTDSMACAFVVLEG